MNVLSIWVNLFKTFTKKIKSMNYWWWKLKAVRQITILNLLTTEVWNLCCLTLSLFRTECHADISQTAQTPFTWWYEKCSSYKTWKSHWKTDSSIISIIIQMSHNITSTNNSSRCRTGALKISRWFSMLCIVSLRKNINIQAQLYCHKRLY